MKRSSFGLTVCTMLGLICLFAQAPVFAADEQAQVIELGDLELTVPGSFERQQPRSRIVAYEFATAPAEGDAQPGRMTIMAAGGSVQANIDRWFGQFTQPDGRQTADVAKIEKRQVAGTDVHLVDVSGTYLDQPGPFAPGVERTDFRMLAAIVETPQANYFIKYYGPSQTVAESAKAFQTMIEGLK